MRYAESIDLKEGDLVVVDHRNKNFGGLVLEIESIEEKYDNWCLRVTLKQPGFDGDFRIKNYDTRHLRRYEP